MNEDRLKPDPVESEKRALIGALFDNEFDRLVKNPGTELAPFFDQFARKLPKKTWKSLYEMTLNGGPQYEGDREFLLACREDFIDLVNHGEVKSEEK